MSCDVFDFFGEENPLGRENFASPWLSRGLPVAFPWWPRHINRRKVSKFHENSQIEVEGRAYCGPRRRGSLASMGRVGSRRTAAPQGRGHAGGCALRGVASRSLPGFAPFPCSLTWVYPFTPQPAWVCPFAPQPVWVYPFALQPSRALPHCPAA